MERVMVMSKTTTRPVSPVLMVIHLKQKQDAVRLEISNILRERASADISKHVKQFWDLYDQIIYWKRKIEEGKR
jgi:hypothetical protein